ncbi:MAG: DUF4190 domain-containing protein [Phycisphaerae bacterium]|nr:DUF4190 domain-containing protein [Phycisphaerae bacterium]NNF44287.1 DUF4190 domain-containing protein [Phycisphaerales bacterium]
MTVAASSRRSLWAVASLVCSLAVCPPLCLIGPLLGVVALFETRRRGTTGRGLAKAGIAVGLAATLGWSVFAWWWNDQAREPMLHGPQSALRAGFAGDVATFEAAFLAPPGEADEAARFIATLRDRYGQFQSATIDEARLDADTPLDRARPLIPYRLQFAEAEISGEAVFVLFQPSSVRPVLRFERLTIVDPAGGDLVYPVSAADGATDADHRSP